jgi:hypothetical protein
MYLWELETSASPAPYVEPLRQAPPVVVEVVGAIGCRKKHQGLETQMCQLGLVFKGPVRSFCLFWKDRDRDRSAFILDHPKTRLDRKRPQFSVFIGLWTSLDQDGSKTGYDRSFG